MRDSQDLTLHTTLSDGSLLTGRNRVFERSGDGRTDGAKFCKRLFSALSSRHLLRNSNEKPPRRRAACTQVDLPHQAIMGMKRMSWRHCVRHSSVPKLA